MGRKRDKTVGHDRLRSLMSEIVDRMGGRLRPVLRQAGIDVDSKDEGGTNYQAINRWFGGRSVAEGPSDPESSGENEGKPDKRKSKPKDFFARPLPEEYRNILFAFVRERHWTEYVKPMPPGETWITADEMATWLQDFYKSGQPGEPMQKWTEDAIRVFNEIWGIENSEEPWD